MNPSFLLWHPLWSDLGCAFDLTPEQFPFLPDDRAPVVAACLKALGWPAARTWEITPFCSPYFGRPQASEWGDRIARAWHVTARFEQPFHGKHSLQLGPREIFVADLEDTGERFVRPQLDCQVIAHFDSHDMAGLRRELEAALRPAPFTLVSLHARVQQLRVDLGPLQLPEEEPRVLEMVARCNALDGRTDWQNAMPLDARYG